MNIKQEDVEKLNAAHLLPQILLFLNLIRESIDALAPYWKQLKHRTPAFANFHY